jgi:hypothetical protein
MECFWHKRRAEEIMTQLLALTFLLAGCAAHTNMRGSVVMKISEQEAHVCLGNGEVHEGSELQLYRNACKDRGGHGSHTTEAPSGETCKRERVATGRITRVLNEHYSVAQFPAGTPFQEGDTVEAKR